MVFEGYFLFVHIELIVLGLLDFIKDVVDNLRSIIPGQWMTMQVVLVLLIGFNDGENRIINETGIGIQVGFRGKMPVTGDVYFSEGFLSDISKQ